MPVKESGDRTGDGPLALPPRVGRLFPAELRERLLLLRRELHADPELSGAERRTQGRLRAALEEIDIRDVRDVGGTGLIGCIPGRQGDGPPVALRGDVDALPIQETTGLPFASRNAGVMHACGHDVHAAWTVAAAHLLSRRPAANDVLILLQPAEERAEGARAILESGALEGVAAIFGGHVDRQYPVGQVVAQPGPLAASTDLFEVVVSGSGGHGARPHETRDPIAAGAALISALYAQLPRRLASDRPTVVSVGSFQAGEAANVIPERALLRGTIRATDPPTRASVVEEVRRIAAAIAAAHGVEAEVDVHAGVPPLVNPPQAAAWARRAAEDVLGASGVVPLAAPNMAGEDFAFYLERMPGCFLRIGARGPGEAFIPAHSPRFHAAEGAIFVGGAVLAEAARRASAALGGGEDGRPHRGA